MRLVLVEAVVAAALRAAEGHAQGAPCQADDVLLFVTFQLGVWLNDNASSS